MKKTFVRFWKNNPVTRKVVGVSCVLAGIVSAVTPFTPFGLLFFVGLEILGIRFLFLNKIRETVRSKRR